MKPIQSSVGILVAAVLGMGGLGTPAFSQPMMSSPMVFDSQISGLSAPLLHQSPTAVPSSRISRLLSTLRNRTSKAQTPSRIPASDAALLSA